MKKILFALMGVAFILSCEKDNNTNSNGSTVDFMKVGNEWIYTVIYEGVEDSTPHTYKILSDEGDGYYNIESTLGILSGSDLYWYYNDGVFAEQSGAYPPDFLFPLVKKNPAVSDNWTCDEEEEDLGTITREIMSINESVTVPAGKITNCIKIKEAFSEDAKIINYFWFSYDYGIVKESATGWLDIDDNPRVYFNLTYSLKSTNF